MQKGKQKQTDMSAASVKIAAFILSVSGLIIALFYMMSDHKEQHKEWVYVGLAFIGASIVLRNLARFKPEWFQEKRKPEE